MSCRRTNPRKGMIARGLRWVDGPLIGPLRKIAAALIVAAGPWIIAIVTLAQIGRSAEGWLAAETLEDMRLSIIYAFMIAPLVAAPIGVIAARVITDTPDLTRSSSVLGALMLVACAVAGLTSEVLAGVVILALNVNDPAFALAFAVLTSSSAMMWTAFIILNACQFRLNLFMSFAAGMGLAMALSQLALQFSASGILLVWCFTAGIAVAFALCLAPFCGKGLAPVFLRHAVFDLFETAQVTWPLALGAFFAIAGIWADKWVAWAGPNGLMSTAGYWHSPTYDSALFLAHLSAVPGLAALVIHFENPARRAMDSFRNTLSNGASLVAAEQASKVLSVKLWTGIHRSMIAQLALSGALLLLAPVIASVAGLRLDQFLILRTGIIGTFLHVFGLSASAVLILCNRKGAFLAVQALFLLVNFSATVLLSTIFDISALGFVFATAVSSIAGTIYAVATIRNILEHYYLIGNDALFR